MRISFFPQRVAFWKPYMYVGLAAWESESWCYSICSTLEWSYPLFAWRRSYQQQVNTWALQPVGRLQLFIVTTDLLQAIERRWKNLCTLRCMLENFRFTWTSQENGPVFSVYFWSSSLPVYLFNYVYVYLIHMSMTTVRDYILSHVQCTFLNFLWNAISWWFHCGANVFHCFSWQRERVVTYAWQHDQFWCVRTT